MIIPFREGKLSPSVKEAVDGICQGPAQQPRGFLHGSRSQESPPPMVYKSLMRRHCPVQISQRFLSTYYVLDITLILGRQSQDQQTP